MTPEECDQKADHFDGEAVRLLSLGDLAGAKAMRGIASSYREDAAHLRAQTTRE